MRLMNPRVINFVNDYLSWRTLREVGNLSAVRMTVLIPAIGYLVLFNENVIQYLKLSPALGAYPQPNSIGARLLTIYFGLTSVALGSLLYSIFCPLAVKLYSTASIFVGSERDNLGDLGLNEMREALETWNPEKYRILAEEMQRRWDILLKNPTVSHAPSAELRKRDATLIMQAYYCALDAHYPLARLAATFSFVLGFGLLAVPSLEVFWRCIVLALGHLTNV